MTEISPAACLLTNYISAGSDRSAWKVSCLFNDDIDLSTSSGDLCFGNQRIRQGL